MFTDGAAAASLLMLQRQPIKGELGRGGGEKSKVTAQSHHIPPLKVMIVIRPPLSFGLRFGHTSYRIGFPSWMSKFRYEQSKIGTLLKRCFHLSFHNKQHPTCLRIYWDGKKVGCVIPRPGDFSHLCI